MPKPKISVGDVLEYALAYGKACLKWGKIYDQVGTVKGLDEFNHKYVKWENRLYKAEQAKYKAKEELLEVAFIWSQDG